MRAAKGWTPGCSREFCPEGNGQGDMIGILSEEVGCHFTEAHAQGAS